MTGGRRSLRDGAFRARLVGAVAGAVFAGLAISVWLLIGELDSGKPSQLTRTMRIILNWFRANPLPVLERPAAHIEYAEQAFHFLLSAAAGVAYVLVGPRKGGLLRTGVLFGAGFFLFAHVVAGPLAGFMPPIWQVVRQEPLLTVALSTGQHLPFGVCTALFAHSARA